MHACPHAALLPLQVSDVHESPSSVQVVPTAWKTSTHALLVPVQWSAASLSHAPPCEAPTQSVATDANPFAGHAADVPLQVSATSHWPAEARHVELAAWKTSTHELLVPVQWSAASLSHAPPCEAPTQPVDTDANAFAGHAADVPVQVSATSHWPAETRHG